MATTLPRRHRRQREMSDGELYAILVSSRNHNRLKFARAALKARGLDPDTAPARERPYFDDAQISAARQAAVAQETPADPERPRRETACAHCAMSVGLRQALVERRSDAGREWLTICNRCLDNPSRTCWMRWRLVEIAP